MSSFFNIIIINYMHSGVWNIQEFRLTCEHIATGDQIMQALRVNGDRHVSANFTDLKEDSAYFVYVLTSNSHVQSASCHFSTKGKIQQLCCLLITLIIYCEI